MALFPELTQSLHALSDVLLIESQLAIAMDVVQEVRFVFVLDA